MKRKVNLYGRFGALGKASCPPVGATSHCEQVRYQSRPPKVPSVVTAWYHFVSGSEAIDYGSGREWDKACCTQRCGGKAQDRIDGCCQKVVFGGEVFSTC